MYIVSYLKIENKGKYGRYRGNPDNTKTKTQRSATGRISELKEFTNPIRETTEKAETYDPAIQTTGVLPVVSFLQCVRGTTALCNMHNQQSDSRRSQNFCHTCHTKK